ncbi:MAG: NitT/TauT family transport system substrate-binding protein, partial [Chloroflexota bacterium]|nr:NitT/TauT family transport system substrate-binding protein [Chloroflexota bacterium]
MDKRRVFALAGAAALIFAACTPGAATTTPASQTPASIAPSTEASGGTASQPPASSSAAAATVRLQLQWAPQAQFAGYFAADKQGYYKAENLTVTMVPGGPDVVPQVEGSKADGPEFTISWVPKVLEAREGGSDLIDIAQVFQRSGTRMASFKAANITSPATMAGKKIGSWLGGNEPELFAGLTKAGLDPTKQNIIKQNFDMSGLLKGDLDVAQAMIYNEY